MKPLVNWKDVTTRAEIEKEDIAFGAFVSLCKSTCKYKNISADIDKQKFAEGKGPLVKESLKLKEQKDLRVHLSEPYKYIDIRYYEDGASIAECWSFEFNEGDDKLGRGYFYFRITQPYKEEN